MFHFGSNLTNQFSTFLGPNTNCNYCWWKKSCTTWDAENLVNSGIDYISTGAGFLPSTVVSHPLMDLFLLYFHRVFHTPQHHLEVLKLNIWQSHPPLIFWAWIKKTTSLFKRWLDCFFLSLGSLFFCKVLFHPDFCWANEAIWRKSHHLRSDQELASPWGEFFECGWTFTPTYLCWIGSKSFIQIAMWSLWRCRSDGCWWFLWSKFNMHFFWRSGRRESWWHHFVEGSFFFGKSSQGFGLVGELFSPQNHWKIELGNEAASYNIAWF